MTGSADSTTRPMTCEIGLLSRSDGSVSFNQGDTSVMAAVYGPVEVKMSKELIDQATVQVVYKNKVGLPGCKERLQERIIRNTCDTVIAGELHPRTAIEIVLQEMQNSGSLLACSVNAACLALLSAAVPMKCMVAAVTVAIDTDGKVTVDPSLKDESDSTAVLTLAFDSVKMNVVTVSTVGCYSNKQFMECVSAAKGAAEKVIEFFKETIKRELSRDL